MRERVERVIGKKEKECREERKEKREEKRKNKKKEWRREKKREKGRPRPRWGQVGLARRGQCGAGNDRQPWEAGGGGRKGRLWLEMMNMVMMMMEMVIWVMVE